MKIAHLVPTLHPGGPEIGLVDLAAAAPAAGFEMVVIALAATSDTTQLSALRRHGVPVAELGLAPWDPRAAGRTAKLLRERKVDIVHSHLAPADVVAAAVAVRNRIPAVSTLHWVDNEPADRMDRLRRSAKIVARQRFVTQTIAISQVQREWYRAVGGAEGALQIVRNGVTDPGPTDPAKRARRRAALEVGEGEALAVCLAPMRRDQCHELLLDAIEQLPDDLPLVVALAGEGPLRPRLEARVAASDALGERIRFVHRHQDPAELLAAGDIALHTPRNAALPTALLRAMAAGRPIVATRVGGVPEIITSATGVLVPLSATAIADALVALTEDVERRERMGTAARARYVADFEAVGWAKRLRAVYEQLLA